MCEDKYKAIRETVETLARKIDAPANLLPTYGYTRDMAYPEVLVDDNGLHYIIVERGREHEHRTTRDLDQLLYWIFDSVTFSMASTYEVHQRQPHKDFRRLLFRRQLELLDTLNPHWRDKRHREIEQVLQTSPFDDTLG